MKIFLGNLFNALSLLLMFAVILMMATGGFIAQVGKNKIEMASVDLWVAGALLMGFFAYRCFHRPPTSWQLLQKIMDQLRGLSKRQSIMILTGLCSVLWLTHLGKHYSLATDAWDMSFLHPALFNPFGEKWLQCDFCLNKTYFGEHLSFTLLLPAFILQYFPSDTLVFLIQTFSLGLGIYLLVFKGPIANQGHLFAIAIILIFSFRALRGSFIWDFREDHLAFLFLSLALLSLWHQKIAAYFSFLILTLMTKEHIGFMTFFLAIPIYFESKFSLDRQMRIKISVATGLISFAYLFLAFKLFIPMVAGVNQNQNNIVYIFGEFGNTPSEVILNVLTSPANQFKILKQILFNTSSAKYLLIMLGGILFLGSKRIWWAAPVMAGLGLNILPRASEYKMMIFHYELAIMPYLIFWMLLSLADFKSDSHQISNRLTWALILFLGLSGRWPGFYLRKYFFQEVSAIRELAQIEGHHIALANSKILPHLSTLAGQRALRLEGAPDDLDEKALIKWFQNTYLAPKNDAGRSRPNNATLIIFDLHQPIEKKLADLMPQISDAMTPVTQSLKERFALFAIHN